jgi:ribosomal protein S12 methylthiotransferase accessory factor YcaO
MRTRAREKLRLRATIKTTDPESLAAFASALKPTVAILRTLAEDATARPSQRQRARVALRRDMLKSLRELEGRLEAAAPPEHGGAGSTR